MLHLTLIVKRFYVVGDPVPGQGGSRLAWAVSNGAVARTVAEVEEVSIECISIRLNTGR